VANEVKIVVTAENHAKAGLSAVKSDLAEVEKSALKASDKITTFGDRSKSVNRDLASLDKSIAESKRSLSALASAFASTDDAAQKIDIKKAMDKIQRDITAASKAKKIRLSDLMDLEPDPAAGKNFVAKLGSSIVSQGGQLSGALGGSVGPVIGAAIGIAAAPHLAGALAGGIAAGSAAAIIGGGIALAVKNDKGIQSAGKRVGTDFMKALGEGAKSYTEPIYQSLDVVSDAGKRVAARLSEAFASTSSLVVPLVRDITQGVEGLVDSISNIAEGSGAEALAGLGDGFRLIMDGLGEGLEAATANGENLRQNLVLVSGATGDLINNTGQLIGMLNDLSSNPWLTGPLLPLLKDHYQEAADASNTMAGSTQHVAAEMTNAQKAAEGEVGALKALSTELTAQTDPVFGLLDAQDQLRAAQKKTAEATKDHGKNSEEAKQALRDQAKAALQLEGRVGELGSAFNGKMTPALRATLKAAGMTDGAIDALEGQFREAKGAAADFAGNYKANVSAPGATQAIGRLYSVRDAANSIPRAIDIAMRITGVTNVSKQAAAIRKAYAHGGVTRVGGAATGGLRDDEWTWVGEQGPELLRLPPSTQVMSAGDSARRAPRLGYNSQLIEAPKRGPLLRERANDNRNNLLEEFYASRGLDKNGKKKKGSSGGGGDYSGGYGSGDLEITLKWEPSGNQFLDALGKQIRLYVKNVSAGNVQEALGYGKR
jgi:hypothetical protein